MPIRAVVFELFNTLTAPEGSNVAVYRASVWGMGLAARVDPEGFTRRWFELWRKSFDGTFATPEVGVRGVCEAIGAAVDAAAVRRAVKVRAGFARQSLRPRADAVDTLGRVRSMGLKTALISDCAADIPDLWPRTVSAEYIDEPLFSCVEGLIEPDSAIYLRACERLGLEPQDCVYVGDGGNHELTGAQGVGMRAVLIRTPEERAASYDSERAAWRGEAIEALSELPRLIADDA